MSDYQISTDCLHAGYRPGNGEPRNIPIIQSTTFRYETSEEMGKLFDLEADSLEAVELSLALEEAFGVGIADEDMAGIKTVSDILEYIQSKKQ